MGLTDAPRCATNRLITVRMNSNAPGAAPLRAARRLTLGLAILASACCTDATAQRVAPPEQGTGMTLPAGLATDDGGQLTSSDVQKLPTKPTPLTSQQKISFGLRLAFLTPGAYIGPALGAYLTESRTSQAPGKTGGDEFADGASYYARNFATQAVANSLGSGVYPIIFRQDPRYYRSPKHGTAARVLYAASRIFVTRGDDGRTEINYSRLAGNFTSVALANLYERNTPASRDRFGRVLTYHKRVGVAATASGFAQSEALDALGYVVFNELDLDGKAWRAVGKLFGKK